MRNETIEGFARGTVENTMLSEANGGTEVLDIVEVRIPGLGRLFEKVIAGYTRSMVTGILMDHKKDIEGECLIQINPDLSIDEKEINLEFIRSSWAWRTECKQGRDRCSASF